MSELNLHSKNHGILRSCRIFAKAGIAWSLAAFALLGTALNSDNVLAARISDIGKTKHNLSVTGPGSVKVYAPPAVNGKVSGPVSYDGNIISQPIKQNQICVFCHTPHGSTLGTNPLWNRQMSSQVYATYTSASLAADTILQAANLGLTPQQINDQLKQPGGSSKLCLSCHDGTLAIGNVNVMWGKGTSDSQWQMIMLGTDNYDPTTFLGGKMPFGGVSGVAGASGAETGYTRNLGIDLTNDHPISVSYTHELALRNGELRDVDAVTQQSVPSTGYAAGAVIGKRARGVLPIPMNPLEGAGTNKQGVGQIQCAACHDPHLRETDLTRGNQKFLRQNRFQEQTPSNVYDAIKDIGCLACHDKNNGTIGTWAYSVHANPNVSPTPQSYKTQEALDREFPTMADGVTGNLRPANTKMWEASCLNCHDTHTVAGARWLLREGNDSTSLPKTKGGSAIEETCYQCHSGVSVSAGILEPAVGYPPANIKADFILPRHMPITLADQQGNLASPGSPATEAHEIGGVFNDGGNADCRYLLGTTKCGADFVESRAKLGVGNLLANRHAECTDCHNPHRAVKSKLFFGNLGNLATPDAGPDGGTHKHTDAAGYTHTNIISGALRGTFGVEPDNVLASNDFNYLPAAGFAYMVKRGDPADFLAIADCAGGNKAACDGKTYVTREYQVCLKCHSDYGYTDDNASDAVTGRPALGSTGLTPAGNAVNKLITHYTNQAREFKAPSTHRGEPAAITDSGAGAAYVGVGQVNYRSWHPVMDSTGRTAVVRGGMLGTAFNLPWSNDVGNQTMQCSDCHGSNVASTTSVIPDAIVVNGTNTTNPWGPHGSTNDFVLKGRWDAVTGDNNIGGKTATTDLCFKCHDYSAYALGVAAATAAAPAGAKRTGFYILQDPADPKGVAAINGVDYNVDGHQLHVDRILKTKPAGQATRCDWCHVAVPHGWKNKGLLVNLNDVGSEAGLAPTGVEVVVSGVPLTTAYSQAPYYNNARLKVIKFKASGTWMASDCGSKANPPGNGLVGLAWMTTGTETCTTPP